LKRAIILLSAGALLALVVAILIQMRRPAEPTAPAPPPVAPPTAPPAPAPAPAPGPTVAPVRRPDAAPRPVPAAPSEPVLTDPRFAGKTRTELREFYENRLRTARQELDQARDVVEQAKHGADIPLDEVKRAHGTMRHLEQRIQLDEQLLGDLDNAK
jgi:hypothetical protein